MGDDPAVVVLTNDMPNSGLLTAVREVHQGKSTQLPNVTDLTSTADPFEPMIVLIDDPGDGKYAIELHEVLGESGLVYPRLACIRRVSLDTTVAGMQRGLFSMLMFPPPSLSLAAHLAAATEFATQASTAMKRWHGMMEALDALTDGELWVLRYLIEGSLNKRIANRLGISERTVEARRKRIFEKTETTSVASLVRTLIETVGAEEITRRCDAQTAGKPTPPRPYPDALLKIRDLAQRNFMLMPHGKAVTEEEALPNDPASTDQTTEGLPDSSPPELHD